MTVADQLRAAAGRVREGWCQHTCRQGVQSVCTIQAIYDQSEKSSHKWWVAQWYLMSFLGVRMEGVHDCSALIRWNDQPSQTAEQVATAMEDAAFQWEVEHGGQSESQGSVPHGSGEVEVVQSSSVVNARTAGGQHVPMGIPA